MRALGSATGPRNAHADLDSREAAIRQAILQDDRAAPVLLVRIPDLDVVAALVIAARNNGAVTWMDASGVALVLQDGVVSATRGLGNDLMAADVSGTLAALSGRRSDPYLRVHRVLNAEGQLLRRHLTCRVSTDQTLSSETCTGHGNGFTNTYRMTAGHITSSRQWLGPQIGYADLTRLR